MNKSFKQGHRPAVTRLASACLGALLDSVIALPAAAYTIDEVLVAEDQHFGEAGLTPAPLYKPHEVVVSQNPNPNKNIWISSNERSGFAGITIFDGSNNVRATLNIEEPGLDWTEEPEEEEIGGAEEEPPEENFPPEVRLDPVICLPVRLPPGALPPTLTVGKGNNKETFQVTSFDEDRICAPLGAEMHARHPHGIDMDRVREIAYQVIEHSGLNWNADRTAFEIAETTDDESAMLLAYDVSDPDDPVIIDGYLLGHGGHEVAVNENNGKVFQGNHEDSPTATPNVWVDVIEPTDANPYGFIDTGWYNAVQGIEVDESRRAAFRRELHPLLGGPARAVLRPDPRGGGNLRNRRPGSQKYSEKQNAHGTAKCAAHARPDGGSGQSPGVPDAAQHPSRGAHRQPRGSRIECPEKK